MRRLAVISMVVLAAATCAAPADANDKLIAALKTLGKAVDDMSANISNAQTDADAELLARVTREALDNGLKQDRPTITIDASAGYCKVTIATPQWDLWSEARSGKIVNHGATIH
jgi:hypothetical protein